MAFCRISVRILWRNIWTRRASSTLINTLIACLPDESKKILCNNVTRLPDESKKILYNNTAPPLFNYVTFCETLSVEELCEMANNDLVATEIIKMFIKQISFLKKLTYHLNRNFINFPGARECLTELSDLRH